MSGTVICDLDGVIYLGDEEVPGAGGALRRLEAGGYRLVFSTNNSSRTRVEGAAKVTRVTGYACSPEQFVSSATAAGRMLGPGDGPAFVVGGPGVREALAEAGLAVTEEPLAARTVVVGLDMELTYAKLAAATRAVRNGAALLATNHDATYPTPEGLLPGAGSLAAALQTATDVTPTVAGKPFTPMRRILAEMAGDGPVWMVGDRADTDLAMAVEEGWTSVLVLTGVVTDPASVDPAPDVVLASIADLPAHLGL